MPEQLPDLPVVLPLMVVLGRVLMVVVLVFGGGAAEIRIRPSAQGGHGANVGLAAGCLVSKSSRIEEQVSPDGMLLETHCVLLLLLMLRQTLLEVPLLQQECRTLRMRGSAISNAPRCAVYPRDGPAEAQEALLMLPPPPPLVPASSLASSSSPSSSPATGPGGLQRILAAHQHHPAEHGGNEGGPRACAAQRAVGAPVATSCLEEGVRREVLDHSAVPIPLRVVEQMVLVRDVDHAGLIAASSSRKTTTLEDR